MLLALDVGLAGLALGIERVEFEIEIMLGRFAGVDRSPTMAPHSDDEKKYAVADKVTERLKAMQANGELLIGQKIRDLVTVSGVRVTVADGTWGLVRASSNKPELVVVVESPVSEARMREMFAAVDKILRENPEVGAYNQTI